MFLQVVHIGSGPSNGAGPRLQGVGCRVQDSGFWVCIQGSGFGMMGSGEVYTGLSFLVKAFFCASHPTPSSSSMPFSNEEV